MGRRARGLVLAALLLAGACSGDDGDDGGGDSSSADDTSATTTATTVPEARYREVVATLASDEFEGRNNQTPGSTVAQTYLTGILEEFTEPLPNAPEGYAWPFGAGTNLIGMIPGGERADEYLVLGAHYDHLGSRCGGTGSADDVCNGAVENAAGVAAALEVARALAQGDEPPERTIVLALWDAEEDGLQGSAAYVADPPVPLEDTIAYLNWDIQGSNLTPSLTDLTVIVGAETGGPDLVDAAARASEASGLRTLALSLLFGQGRSDHAEFAEAGVPVVFFTDSTNSCYHTVHDDVDEVDFGKLGQQITTAVALAEDLAATDDVPEFDAAAPPASFTDAQSMFEVVDGSQEDFDILGGGGHEVAEAYLADLQGIVDAGEAAFDDAAVSTLLGGAVDIVEALTTGECTGFVDQ